MIEINLKVDINMTETDGVRVELFPFKVLGLFLGMPQHQSKYTGGH